MGCSVKKCQKMLLNPKVVHTFLGSGIKHEIQAIWRTVLKYLTIMIFCWCHISKNIKRHQIMPLLIYGAPTKKQQ